MERSAIDAVQCGMWMSTYVWRPACPAVMFWIYRLYITVMTKEREVLGSLDALDTSSGSALSNAGKVWSFCLRFDGSYWDRQGKLRWVRQGAVYSLRASLEGPLATADKAIGRRAQNTTVRHHS